MSGVALMEHVKVLLVDVVLVALYIWLKIIMLPSELDVDMEQIIDIG